MYKRLILMGLLCNNVKWGAVMVVQFHFASVPNGEYWRLLRLKSLLNKKS